MKTNIVYLAILTLFFSCDEKSVSNTNKVSSTIKIDTIHFDKGSKYKSGIVVKLLLQNVSNENIYFFEPFLKTTTKSGQNISNILMDDDYKEIMNDEISQLHIFQYFKGTALGNSLAIYAKENHLMVDTSSVSSLYIKNMIFLKKGESVVIKDEFYPIIDNNLKNNGENVKILSDNISLIGKAKTHNVYETLPAIFKGYKLWKGSIKKDSLDVFFPKNLGFQVLERVEL